LVAGDIPLLNRIQTLCAHTTAALEAQFAITDLISIMSHQDYIAALVDVGNDVREALSRLLRVETHVANLNLKALNVSNQAEALTVKVDDIQLQMKELQATTKTCCNSVDLSKSSQESSSSNDSLLSDYCGFQACRENLSHGNRPCSAAVSLRHMLECDHCPSTECRYMFILNHLANFAKAPQVCHVDICCYCGLGLQMLSPDARSSHRKVCIIAAKDKCQNPVTHDATVQLFLRIWNPTDAAKPSPAKRKRTGEINLAQQLSPIIASRNSVVSNEHGLPCTDRPLPEMFHPDVQDADNDDGNDYDAFSDYFDK
jgi:hypothetical protein